jgi:Rne/Rng family ribonuclease
MAKEICISSTPHETRLAILEDDQLAEIYYERENEYTLAGSIYNGRVTRVLPGMQSAFVDLGLERDAFLYVTDFMELEDSEETDELEKAAASGANQPPREIRHTNDGSQRNTQQRQEQQQRDRRPAPAEQTIEPPARAAEAPVESADQTSGVQEDQDASGGRRWRGRRHRRGARGQGHAAEGRRQSEPQIESVAASSEEPQIAHEIHASAHRAEEPAPRAAAEVPVPFVLPGESLSKYGGSSASEESNPVVEAPVRPSNFSKPSTLVEAPIEWDGTGLLPGESLSKHRSRQTEPEAEAGAEPAEASAFETAAEPAPAREQNLVEETEEFELDPHEVAPDFEATMTEEASADQIDEVVEEVLNPEQSKKQPENEPQGSAELAERTEPIAEDVAPAEARPTKPASTEFAEAELEEDGSASHNVDPLPPSSFRLFGFGKKDKRDEEPAAKTPEASVKSVSAYAPGSGLIEEEVIEGEEYDPLHHPRHQKEDAHDLDDYEEETLATQVRSGELGEMLQEAHLDHKIQLNFDEKNGENEAFEEEEEEENGEAQAPSADGTGQQRRERGGRGRRGGRGGPQRGGDRRGGAPRRSMQTIDLPVISDLLKPGQEILVQIAKEPIAKKGARITSHIALPGRFLVFMPTVTHIGVSRKIASDEERHRLKRILMHERGESSGGFIVRTAAEGASEDELRADLRFLMNLWNEIKQRSESSKSPALIYHDLSLIERILRDQVSSNFSNIWVDSEADYERIVRFLNRFSPTLVRRVKLYTKETPLFEHFGIQDEISKALRSKVWLKSGGSIVINQTEALVAIDINTGKYVGKSARLEDTILKTNLDAVPEIVRQIRLRDLGGIIVIDFIDMDERKNRFKVMAALEEALKSDRAPTKVLQFNDFGLVAITRKRVKQSLERTLSVPCPTCQATGMVKSPITVCNEIFIELRKMKRHFEGADVLLRVNPETVKVLKSNNASWLVEFEELTGKNILVKSDATLHPEQFDIQG